MKKVVYCVIALFMLVVSSCSSDIAVGEEKSDAVVLDQKSIDEFYKEAARLKYSLVSMTNQSITRSGDNINPENTFTPEEMQQITEYVDSLDARAINLLMAYGFSSQDITEMRVGEVPMVATVVAYEMLECADNLEAYNPETPLPYTPDGRQISYEDFKDMGWDCLLDVIGLSPQEIGENVFLYSFSSEGFKKALTEIGKIAAKNVAKYLSKGSLGLCLFMWSWGNCMIGKLDTYGAGGCETVING
jgi:hypothetical protein